MFPRYIQSSWCHLGFHPSLLLEGAGVAEQTEEVLRDAWWGRDAVGAMALHKDLSHVEILKHTSRPGARVPRFF